MSTDAGITRIDRFAWAPLALPVAALAIAADLSGFDRWTAGRFYDGALHTFPARHAFWAEQVLHRGGIWIVVLAALLALAALVKSPWRREALYVLACMALTTGSVALLKQRTPIDCPWDVRDYGGSRPYTHLLQLPSSSATGGHCFPGGHSSGAFSFVAFAFALAARGSRQAKPVLAAAFALGLLYALTQWMRGAHYPSHDLWSAFIAWSIACALQPLLLDRRALRGAASAAAMLLLTFHATPAKADDAVVREIVYRGNEVTQEAVMQREISIAIGAPASEADIENSRQAIQNLGLFREVIASTEPLPEGKRVIFSVREKWYLLAYPRVSADADGQNALGAELRWNNLWGANHSLRAVVSSADRKEEGRGRQLSYLGSYRAPFVLGSPFTFEVSASHATTPVDEDALLYDESIDEVQLLLSRKIGERGAASQGWSAGGGLLWHRQTTQGELAPEPFGSAYALVAQTGYLDLQNHIFSETGQRFSTRFELADQHMGSDYSYSRITANYKRSMALGDMPHQTLEWTAEGGNANAGPPDHHRDFSLGGSNGLHGYERNSFQGDFYYLVGVNYLRPLHWDWLRLVAGIEGGNVYNDADEMNTNVRWNFNLGLRLRVPKLVNFEFEAGVALPLDNDGTRIYGSRNGF